MLSRYQLHAQKNNNGSASDRNPPISIQPQPTQNSLNLLQQEAMTLNTEYNYLNKSVNDLYEQSNAYAKQIAAFQKAGYTVDSAIQGEVSMHEKLGVPLKIRRSQLPCSLPCDVGQVYLMTLIHVLRKESKDLVGKRILLTERINIQKQTFDQLRQSAQAIDMLWTSELNRTQQEIQKMLNNEPTSPVTGLETPTSAMSQLTFKNFTQETVSVNLMLELTVENV